MKPHINIGIKANIRNLKKYNQSAINNKAQQASGYEG
jgi:hypothetical protein